MLNINFNIPREVSTAVFGITTTAASSVLIQIIQSSHSSSKNVLRNFAIYSCGSASIIGAVMTVYSMMRLCQKVVPERNELTKSIAVTVLGGLGTALVQSIGEHFWTIAPSFYSLGNHSMAYASATNFAWQASLITGLGGIVFTANAAYRLGLAVINKNS